MFRTKVLYFLLYVPGVAVQILKAVYFNCVFLAFSFKYLACNFVFLYFLSVVNR